MSIKLEKLKSGSYRARKTYKGVTYRVTFDYKPTQKEIMQALAAEMDRTQGNKQRITFQTAAEKYISSKENVISPSTVREYIGTLGRLSEHFRKMLLSDITPLDVQAEINRLSKDHAPKTIRNYHGFISAILGTFRPEVILNTTLPKKSRNAAYIPTDEDVKKIMEASRGSIFEIPLILACFGLRRSEICALTQDDIDGNYIIINKALVLNKDKQWVLKTTKTPDSQRRVWVPDAVISQIRKNEKIYTGHPGSISRYLERLQDQLGIQHFSLHKLRHYYASMSHALGIPDSYIMVTGGWKSPQVLQGVYRHALKDKENEMQQFAGEYLQEVLF